jgi:hypothetical protein
MCLRSVRRLITYYLLLMTPALLWSGSGVWAVAGPDPISPPQPDNLPGYNDLADESLESAKPQRAADGTPEQKSRHVVRDQLRSGLRRLVAERVHPSHLRKLLFRSSLDSSIAANSKSLSLLCTLRD